MAPRERPTKKQKMRTATPTLTAAPPVVGHEPQAVGRRYKRKVASSAAGLPVRSGRSNPRTREVVQLAVERSLPESDGEVREEDDEETEAEKHEVAREYARLHNRFERLAEVTRAFVAEASRRSDYTKTGRARLPRWDVVVAKLLRATALARARGDRDEVRSAYFWATAYLDRFAEGGVTRPAARVPEIAMPLASLEPANGRVLLSRRVIYKRLLRVALRAQEGFGAQAREELALVVTPAARERAQLVAGALITTARLAGLRAPRACREALAEKVLDLAVAGPRLKHQRAETLVRIALVLFGVVPNRMTARDWEKGATSAVGASDEARSPLEASQDGVGPPKPRRARRR